MKGRKGDVRGRVRGKRKWVGEDCYNVLNRVAKFVMKDEGSKGEERGREGNSEGKEGMGRGRMVKKIP